MKSVDMEDLESLPRNLNLKLMGDLATQDEDGDLLKAEKRTIHVILLGFQGLGTGVRRSNLTQAVLAGSSR